MSHRSTALVLAAAAATLLAAPLRAQQSDSVAFRKGQWAAEFAAGSDFNTLGVQRFLSPSHALVVDGYLSAARNTTKAGNPQTEETNTSWSGSIRLGSRWYRSIAPKVKQFVTIGAYASGSRNSNGGTSVNGTTSGFGGYGNLGAAWFPAEHLSLGAAWEASAGYSHSRQPTSLGGTTTQNNFGGSLFLGRLVVALYF